MRRVLKGTGVSAGVARGAAFVLNCGDRAVAPRRTIQASELGSELWRSRPRQPLQLGRAELLRVVALLL